MREIKSSLQIVFHKVNMIIKQNILEVSFDSGCVVHTDDTKTKLATSGVLIWHASVEGVYLSLIPCACRSLIQYTVHVTIVNRVRSKRGRRRCGTAHENIK